jgi:L-ascorbate metabolism protein UlaG (beta-lactamase superfamily)
MTIKVTWFGHSGYHIQGDDAAIVIDPFLTGNPVAQVKPEDVSCNALILTHGHSDHLGDGIAIAKANDALLIAPYELATWCEWQGVKNVHPMHLGGAFEFPFGRVKLTLALHGSAVIEEGNIIYTGNPCGVLLTMEGKTIYHAGDTGLFYDMKLIGEMNNIDLALLPAGGNFTMDIDDAVKAAELLQPKCVVPMHYNTFDLIAADAGEFVSKCASINIEAKVLEVGETLEV